MLYIENVRVERGVLDSNYSALNYYSLFMIYKGKLVHVFPFPTLYLIIIHIQGYFGDNPTTLNFK